MMVLDANDIISILDKLLQMNEILSSIVEEVEDTHIQPICDVLDKIEDTVDIISNSIEF